MGLYWVSLYLYVPTLPVYTQTLTSKMSLVGVVLAQYGLWQAVIRLPLGIASDRIGLRKPFIYMGLLLAAFGAWLMGRAETIHGVLIGRAITGVSAGAWVVMVVAFSSLFPPNEAVRATALLTLVNSISRALATGVTGLLNDLGGFRLAFYLSAVVALAAGITYWPINEKRLSRVLPTFLETGTLLIRKDVLLPSILNAVVQYAIYSTTFGFLPILAKQLGASNLTQSMLVSMNIAVGLVGNLITTGLARKVDPPIFVLTGFMLISGGIGILWFADQLDWIYLAQYLLGLGGGIAYPTLMGLSIQYVEGSARSTAMGLHQALYALGMFGGPWFSGILADWIGIPAMFAITAIFIFIFGLRGYLLMLRYES